LSPNFVPKNEVDHMNDPYDYLDADYEEYLRKESEKA
jgi:hypothetical protein